MHDICLCVIIFVVRKMKNQQTYIYIHIRMSYQIDVDVPLLERLKGVKQAGIATYINHVNDPSQRASQYSRYDHSLGVAQLTDFLLRKASDRVVTPQEHKIAVFTALIHDLQHPAFSHVIDQIYGVHFQETMRQQLLNTPTMIAYLESINIPVSRLVSDGGNPTVPILKSSWPDLNTDRLDYFLRDAETCAEAGSFPAPDRSKILQHLRVNREGIIYCTDLKTARDLFEISVCLSTKWKSPTNVGEQILFARILDRYLTIRHLPHNHLYQRSDIEIIQEILQVNDLLSVALKRLLDGLYKFVRVDHMSENVFKDQSHIRLLDPLVGDQRLSELDPVVRQRREQLLGNVSDVKIMIMGEPTMDQLLGVQEGGRLRLSYTQFLHANNIQLKKRYPEWEQRRRVLSEQWKQYKLLA
jgi:HD superfamily phosphohydrolase